MKKNKFCQTEAREVASNFFEMDKVQGICISACAIMRNEISHVGLWLKNVRNFASEIIVVDTGSQDDTREFLQNQPDVRLICYEWQNDFAAAKNIALREVHGDWIVFTDADECFYAPQEIVAYLQELASKAPHVEAVFCPIDNIDVDNNDELIGSDVVPRIIRNHCQIRYMGAVHEQLTKSNEPWQGIDYIVADRKFAIRHTGYSFGIVKQKHKRNYRITKQAMTDSSNSARYYGFLSESLLGMDRYQEALENAILAMESPYQPEIQKERFCQVAVEAMDKLGISIQDIFSQEEAERICLMILSRNKWHEIALCQWLDMMLRNSYADSLNVEYISIIEKLQGIYDSHQDQELLVELLQRHGYIALVDKIVNCLGIGNKIENVFQEVYSLLTQHKIKDIEQKLLPEIKIALNILFVALLGGNYSTGTWYQEKLNLLSLPQQKLVKIYHGKDQNVSMEPIEYVYMIDAVTIYGNSKMLAKYLQIAKGMPGNWLKIVGNKLLECECYNESLEIFGLIQADDEAVTSDFWLACGKSLYYLHDYGNAMEAFDQAGKMGCDSKELESYQAWCKAVMAI